MSRYLMMSVLCVLVVVPASADDLKMKSVMPRAPGALPQMPVVVPQQMPSALPQTQPVTPQAPGALPQAPTALPQSTLGNQGVTTLDQNAEVQRLIELREKIYATQSVLQTALNSARANRTYTYLPFRYVCTADDYSELDFVTGAIKPCNGPTLCSVRFAYTETQGSCQSGKFADLCVTTDMCHTDTACDTSIQRCVPK